MYSKWTDVLTTVDAKGPLPSLTDYIANTALSHTLTQSICQTGQTLRFQHRSLSTNLPTQEFVFTIECMHTQDRLATQCYFALQFAHFKLYPWMDTLSESVNMLPQQGMLTLRIRLQYRAVWYRGVLPCWPFAPFFLTVCLSQPRRPISVTPLIQPTLPYQGKQQGRKGEEQGGVWKSIKMAGSGNPPQSPTLQGRDWCQKTLYLLLDVG